MEIEPVKTVLAIGDTHFPWAHEHALRAVYAAAKKLQPQIIVQIGDLYDMYSFTRFARSQNILKPVEELESGRKDAFRFWNQLQAACPKAKCFQLLGNHDDRLRKRILDTCPEFESIVARSLEEPYLFHKVETVFEKELELDGVVYQHGHYTQHGKHLKHNMKPTVHGHTHRPCIIYENIRDSVIWEMDVGYLGDPAQKPLQYSANKYERWTHGVGYIDELGPHFLPYRWG